MTDIERVNEYLTKAGTFYMSTIDGDKPKCRPISFHMLLDGKIYFGVGEFKAVYYQLQENPNVEMCACTGEKFLRYYGVATFDKEPEIAEKALEALPMLRQIYNEETGYTLGMFTIESATAEFRGMMGVEESITL